MTLPHDNHPPTAPAGARSFPRAMTGGRRTAQPPGARWLLALAAGVLGACANTPPPTALERPPGLDAPAPRAAAPRGGVPAGIVSVTSTDPAQFSDARSGARDTDRVRQAWVDALSLHLADQAAPLLPEGQRLEVRITDVQRAGNFEPWRGPQAADLRVVRDVYPPRIDLDFKLLRADGSVLREGRRQLRDATFLMRPDRYPSDPLRHEKTLVDDWVRKEFASAR